MNLFLDSTSSLKIGLIEDGQFVFFEDYDDRKSSASIHRYIYQSLLRYKKEVTDLEATITIAGPGSYTGIRVTYGLAQIFAYLGIPHYSLYHFEIPAILGVSSGTWYSYAYKNEIFTYTWDGDSSSIKLIPIGDFSDSQQFFNASSNSQFQNTLLLLRDNVAKILFYLQRNRVCRKLIYYRQIEDEFKKQSAPGI
jgi:tRNA threonylcarbamoyladenosine biosynthesis protein TsaB